MLLIKLPGASAASCTVDVVASFLLISHACVNGSVIQILISAALASMVRLHSSFIYFTEGMQLYSHHIR